MAATEAADKTAIPRMENLEVAEACVCNDSKTDVLKNSNEEGNWSYMSEDSSQKGDAEAQRQRASQGRGLSTACEYTEDEIQQLVAQRKRARPAQGPWVSSGVHPLACYCPSSARVTLVFSVHSRSLDGSAWSVLWRVTKNDILARIALREEARWKVE